MTPELAQSILTRIDATWPQKQARTMEEYGQWLDFLRPYDFALSERALDELRAALRWRPTMADFRSAYQETDARTGPDRPALPGGSEPEETLADRYGTDRDSWVYCCKCDMAISLVERSENPCYRPGYGLHHARCPKPGTAPIMPIAERTARAERLHTEGKCRV